MTFFFLPFNFHPSIFLFTVSHVLSKAFFSNIYFTNIKFYNQIIFELVEMILGLKLVWNVEKKKKKPFMVTKGESGQGMNWEIGIDIHIECVLSYFSCIQLFATQWTVDWEAPLSMEFHRQEYWSGLPCHPPGDFSDPEIKSMSPASPTSLALQMDSLPTEPPGKPDIYTLLYTK